MVHFFPFKKVSGLAETLARALLVCAAIALFSIAAQAVTASPTNKYADAPVRVIEALRNVSQTDQYFLKSDLKARWMQVRTETSALYLFIRLESSGCDEWCPNAVFEGEVSSGKFVAFVLLPKKSFWGDTRVRPCAHCEHVATLLFVDDQDKWKSVAINKDGLIF